MEIRGKFLGILGNLTSIILASYFTSSWFSYAMFPPTLCCIGLLVVFAVSLYRCSLATSSPVRFIVSFAALSRSLASLVHTSKESTEHGPSAGGAHC